MFKSNSFALYVLISLVIMTATSCISNKNIQGNDRALVKNKIKIFTPVDNKRKNNLKLSLESLYKQKPTKINLFNPRTWGKVYTIYDVKEAEKTQEDFRNLLVNRKGFYKAEVSFEEKPVENGVEIWYKINTGPQFYIDTLTYSSQDRELLTSITTDLSKKIIRSGDPLDAATFDKEKDRIVSLLQNSGYANFTRNYIEFRGDSTAYGGVNIDVHIFPPSKDGLHQQYTIGEINVYTDHFNGEYTAVSNTDTLDGIKYHARGEEFAVKPSGISSAIGLKRGALYRKSMEGRTYNRLTALSPYRFAIINPIVESANDSIINFDIFLTPRANRWAFDAGTNLFYSTFSQGARNNLLGFNSTFNLENRNFLNKAYKYSIDLEGTFEFDFSNFPTIDPNTISFQLDNRVEIPKNLELFNFAKFLNKINIVKNKAYEKFKAETTTELSVGLGYNDIFDLYTLRSVSASWSYSFLPNPRTRIRYNQLGLNYVNIDTDPLFEQLFLIPNPLLAESFTSQLFTGILFRDLSVYRLTPESKKRTQWALIGNIEVSGLENYAVNSLVNLVQGDSDYWTLGKINFAKYVRLENDIRFYKKFRGKQVLALRFNTGVAFTYGADENIVGDGTVPFVKQYFVGGPNSLRAWRLRELGPGATQVDNTQIQPFQSGNFKLDLSAEYRFKLFWLMDGAVFIDAGNVWNFKGPSEGVLSSSFLNQMAVGTGWGIRFDLTYFILRFDMGYKIRNPFPDPETGSHNAIKSNTSVLGNVNFAINYPF